MVIKCEVTVTRVFKEENSCTISASDQSEKNDLFGSYSSDEDEVFKSCKKVDTMSWYFAVASGNA